MNGHVASPNMLNGHAVLQSDTIHIEVKLYPDSTARYDTIRRALRAYLEHNIEALECDSDLEGWESAQILSANVERIIVAESASGRKYLPVQGTSAEIHVYQTGIFDAVEEFAAGDGDEDEGEPVMAATVAELPSKDLDGLWKSLIYADDVKLRLLNYIYTTVLFSDANVDFNVVSWNRVCLLHGPPGTGKTSLCRALAQKLSIRLSERYCQGRLVEINSHSLFSKWFSESGKLVQRLFSMVTDLVEDEQSFVVILIDEVESLTAARTSSMSGTEPSDALRVVNALLTQLDKLKARKNVLVMTTSNISEAIDSAFVDRADIKQYIGLPPPQAIYWILRSCLDELMRVGLAERIPLLDWSRACMAKQNLETAGSVLESSRKASIKMWELAEACEGLSGRTLRKLPVLAHARHIGMSTIPIACEEWVDAMRKAAVDARQDLAQAKLGTGSGGGTSVNMST
ncbi:AAA-domain-containing protein [Tilletiaria anomala UBC 951]|uniref:AAA-domain-containing protein n=1 Tax=Tilletiaria anomala (strain ATCC 24038 / CBS 436.72 / UBC 951) TaxID=1037660 RepID=A0A066VXR2_TILAU|nr:AAA-domain-containing protein [Tilletiaria anomala UBC 951]KDN45078.1 AAA-domain-containing protein [Tilletiaria anomala UBC 951]